MKITQAFVLAGGKGERLRPLTDKIPKPLVEVSGKPILQYCIESLASHGVKEIILATGHMHEKVEKYFGSGEKFGVNIVYSVEEEPLGTGGALKEAEQMLDWNFFMLNGDNIADFDFTDMAKQHFSSGALATIALKEVADVSGFGVARIDGKRIVEFVEKPKIGEEPSHLVNAGAYIIQKDALEMLPAGFNLIERTLFPKLAQGGKLFWFTHRGLWLTTDTPQRLKAAEKEISQKKQVKFSGQFI
ncbi:MAG TPA: nucleotidyltransferase family protein [archaeon]|nr:nucleotidyltransferase family protein [archaeon]